MRLLFTLDDAGTLNLHNVGSDRMGSPQIVCCGSAEWRRRNLRAPRNNPRPLEPVECVEFAARTAHSLRDSAGGVAHSCRASFEAWQATYLRIIRKKL